MQLDPDDFETIRQTRDPRFDGCIFVGVLSTGIYCRPICPARVPKKENVRLYTCAAEAAEAGFRPCLRCHPESAPGTPQWLGGSFIVGRALQLISHGALNECSVTELATKCDVGVRQLNRLFAQYVGASPIAVANNQRLHLAKKLIDESTLPMSQICFAAGFNSVRRFNSVFLSVYGKAPLAMRRARKGQQDLSESGLLRLKLHFRPPFDWPAMLTFLKFRAIPNVESVADDSYSRTIEVGTKLSEIHVQFFPEKNWLLLSVRTEDSAALFSIIERVRAMFDLRAVSNEIDEALAKDPLLHPIVRRFPGTRVPIAWDGFEIAVRAIIGQQVSVKGASTLVARLANAYGKLVDGAQDSSLSRVFPSPQVLAEAQMIGLGITNRRVEAIRALAQAVVDGRVCFDGSMTTPQLQESLITVSGIGPWTAQYIALRALGDPDAFPHADLILLRAAGEPDAPLTPKKLLELSNRWRPWRAYAVLLLWRHYADLKSN